VRCNRVTPRHKWRGVFVVSERVSQLAGRHEQKAPQVGWEIAEVIVAGLRKKDPAAADAARAYLRVAILAR
jgi:hypothetical protein